jgi:hypothetical protein
MKRFLVDGVLFEVESKYHIYKPLGKQREKLTPLLRVFNQCLFKPFLEVEVMVLSAQLKIKVLFTH